MKSPSMARENLQIFQLNRPEKVDARTNPILYALKSEEEKSLQEAQLKAAQNRNYSTTREKLAGL